MADRSSYQYLGEDIQLSQFQQLASTVQKAISNSPYVQELNSQLTKLKNKNLQVEFLLQNQSLNARLSVSNWQKLPPSFNYPASLNDFPAKPDALESEHLTIPQPDNININQPVHYATTSESALPGSANISNISESSRPDLQLGIDLTKLNARVQLRMAHT